MVLRWQKASLPTGIRRLTWPVAVFALGLYAIYAVASTQEILALARARVEAMRLLQARGIPPTQLEVVGHVNNPDIQNPPDTYQDGKGYAPSIHPLFFVRASLDPRMSSMLLDEVAYFSLLPPFHRQVFVYRATPSKTGGL